MSCLQTVNSDLIAPCQCLRCKTLRNAVVKWPVVKRDLCLRCKTLRNAARGAVLRGLRTHIEVVKWPVVMRDLCLRCKTLRHAAAELCKEV
jgi:hypothetical protein